MTVPPVSAKTLSRPRAEITATPLGHLRVLELGRDIPAAYCARQFALWGADVAVAEPAEGSPIRRMHPFATPPGGEARSLVWDYVGAGKRSLDEAALRAPGALDRLLAATDVLVTDLDDAALAGFGTSLEAIAAAHPDLVVVAISPFGRSGPFADLKGSDLVIQALTGYLSMNGLPDQPPLRAPGHIIGYAVGVSAFVGALATLFRRERGGRGGFLEVSGFETIAAMVPYLRIQYLGGERRREGGTEGGVRILPCADGFISIQTNHPGQRRTLAEALGIPIEEWPKALYDGAYREVVDRTVALASRYTAKMPLEEVFHAVQSRGIVCGKVQSVTELVTDPHLAARGFFQTLRHPDLGDLAFPGPAAHPEGFQAAAPQPAPRRARLSPDDLAWTSLAPGPCGAPASDPRPLAGLRVLDMTQAWIGPFAALALADLGAEVIKIESHLRPDVWRQASPSPVALGEIKAEAVNRSCYFNSVNRNKRSLALNLATPQGKDIFRQLTARADVVVENYTPQVMARFGLDYPELRKIQPDLVMCAFSGYGKTGPLADYKTNGSGIEAMAGWNDLHRYPGGPPVLMGFYPADPICGLQMAAMVLMGLIRRERGGGGSMIEGSMLEAAAGYIGEALLAAQLRGPPKAQGGGDPDMAPSGVYPCAGEDRWIALSIPDDTAWRGLLSLPGRPAGLDDPAFATAAERLVARVALDETLGAWTRMQKAPALAAALQAAGVAAAVVRPCGEALACEHLAARDWFTPLTHPDLGEHRYNGFLWRLAGAPLTASRHPPRLGEHSEELLRELLGLTDTEIAVLKENDVTGAVL